MKNVRIHYIASLAFLALPVGVFAQPAPAMSSNPLISSSQSLLASSKRNVLRSAEKIGPELWNWQPTPEVRTFGQLFAHIADGQYEFCGAAVEGKPVDKGIEKTAKSKEEVVTALKAAFEYCEAAYTKLTPQSVSETVNFGRPLARIVVMDFNVAHTQEHYGNLVTYMRLKGIVPPSSEPKK